MKVRQTIKLEIIIEEECTRERYEQRLNEDAGHIKYKLEEGFLEALSIEDCGKITVEEYFLEEIK